MRIILLVWIGLKCCMLTKCAIVDGDGDDDEGEDDNGIGSGDSSDSSHRDDTENGKLVGKGMALAAFSLSITLSNIVSGVWWQLKNNENALE